MSTNHYPDINDPKHPKQIEWSILDEGSQDAMEISSDVSQSSAIETYPLVYANDLPIEAIIENAHQKGISEFVIFIKPENKTFGKYKPFAVKKEVVFKTNTERKYIRELKISRNGFLILKTDDAATAINALKIKCLCNQKVKSELQKDCIVSKFVIKGVEPEIPPEEIFKDLVDQDILPLEIKRFSKTTEKGRILFKTLLVTQIGKAIPQKVRIFYEIFKTWAFLEKLNQCTNCWKFSHSSQRCRSNKVCKYCAKHHDETQCNVSEQNYLCNNCNKNHSADNIICPFRINEERILKLKGENNISYFEAKIRIKNLHNNENTNNKNFAEITRNHNLSELSNASKYEEKWNRKLKEIEEKFVSLEKKIEENLSKKLNESFSEISQKLNTKFDTLLEKVDKQFATFLNRFDDLVTIEPNTINKRVRRRGKSAEASNKALQFNKSVSATDFSKHDDIDNDSLDNEPLQTVSKKHKY